MRVLFLTSGNRTPSTRFRILPYIPYLQEHGIRCRVASSFPQKYDYFPWLGFRPSQRLKQLTRWLHLLESKVRTFDVVYLERELFNDDTSDMEQRFRRVAPRLIYDLDDAVFLQRPDKVERLTRMSDLVVVGNPQIQEALSAWHDRFEVIPTAPSVSTFRPATKKTPRDSTVVGWIGTSGNLAYFAVVAEALRQVAKSHRFELRLIVPGMEHLHDIDLSGVNVTHVPWDGFREAQQVADIDIGIMPLFSDREWDRYKCPTKITQYMACGIPSIASPVGFTADVIEDEVDGFHANSTDAWVSSLCRLLDSQTLREKMGRAARRKAENRYSVEANAPKMLAAIRSCCADT
ncbi:MAG: glycosyltransferase family 4 protein [Fuerstiella sp.]